MSKEKDCIFCKIVKGEIPCAKIWGDDNFLAFLDINPVNEGHTIIIPKKHCRWMYDVPDELLGDIFVKCKKIMKAIKDTMKADYVAVSVVGLDVPHFHIHLVPRYKDDGMANFWPTKKYSEDRGKEIAKKIKMALGSADLPTSAL